jgi:hypothetical protein
MRGIQFLFEMEERASVERDDTCTITLILTPNSRIKRVFKPAPHRSQYLGATRTGSTFHGVFNVGSNIETHWNWDDYDDGTLQRHPANSWTTGSGDRYQHDVTAMPRPTGAYLREGNTQGWSRRRQWKDHLKRSVRAKRAATPGMTEADARVAVLQDEATRSGVMAPNWDTLNLKNWEGHHIHECSWDGPHVISNIIFVEGSQHDHFTQWWEDRTRVIRDELGLER